MSRVKSNPLSTRFVQPGRLAWQPEHPEHSIERLANYFTCKLNWRAAIVGPHGSGKSTLLEHLVPKLGRLLLKQAAYEPDPSERSTDIPDSGNSAAPANVDRAIVWLKLRGRGPSVQLLKRTKPEWFQPGRLLVIDGYEQLSILSRGLILQTTLRKSVGLLITSHRPTMLPTLVNTKVDGRLAQRLLDQLLPADLPDREQFLSQDRLNQLLASHHGNLREVFMQLYDEIESVARHPGQSPS